ncbi:MAG TPA: hypothetical protein VHX38_20780 [Pseudonocardiaceae bacterium]|jgi:hypothetical protein|nr:hypothetical protein [Pseudonocardiaceae bacterium]
MGGQFEERLKEPSVARHPDLTDGMAAARRSMRASATTRSVPSPERAPDIEGLTDPYTGAVAALRWHAYGYTFRWVRGDRYIGVQRGTCIDGRRILVIRDHLSGEQVRDGHQPLVGVIPANPTGWDQPGELRRIVEKWAAARHLDTETPP